MQGALSYIYVIESYNTAYVERICLGSTFKVNLSLGLYTDVDCSTEFFFCHGLFHRVVDMKPVMVAHTFILSR